MRKHDVLIRRERVADWERVVVNIQRKRIVAHSPDGYEYGYPGSGPADLALNILDEFVYMEPFAGPDVKCYRGRCSSFAWEHHQEFKRDFIARLTMSSREHRISAEAIKRWIDDRRIPTLRDEA